MRRAERVRVVNPSRRKARVRVINPSAAAAGIFEAFINPDTELQDATEIFEEFSGRASEFVDEYDAAPGTPRTLAELGGLSEIETDEGEVLDFDPEEHKLCSDTDLNLHITGPREIDDEMPTGEKVFVGHIRRVDYEAEKPLHYEGVQTYTHDFDEEERGLELPELYYQDGFYIIEPFTGDYTVTADGIADGDDDTVPNGLFSSIAEGVGRRAKKSYKRRKAARAAGRAGRAAYLAKRAASEDKD
jgi:hypothetical protein